ncbi:propionate/acetate kinase, partial [Escherichia coli]|nr:propionate/acetate kinase [Escherichia coli]
RNQQLFGGRSGLISKTDTTKIAVIPTNEEKMIAIDAAEIARTA